MISSCALLSTVSLAVNTDTLKLQQNTIVIDGNLNDWKNIPYTNDFVQHDNNGVAKQKTKAKVTWDNENLYLAFDVEDTEIVGKVQNHDAGFFGTDDLVEFFLDPDGDGLNYLEIGINASGSVYDYVIKCPSASCGGWADDVAFNVQGMEVKTTINGTLNNPTDVDTGYIVECKIPFASLTIQNGNFAKPANNTNWRVNMFRIDYQTENVIEYQSWTPHNAFGFHQPSKFGVFHFMTTITNSFEKVEEPTWQIVDNKIVTEEKIQLFDYQGKPVSVQKQENFYDLSSLKTSIYIIYFEDKNYRTKIFVD